jgi:opacity protein-like surface antigen
MEIKKWIFCLIAMLAANVCAGSNSLYSPNNITSDSDGFSGSLVNFHNGRTITLAPVTFDETRPTISSFLAKFRNRPWWLNPIFTLTGGVAFAKIGQTQTLTMTNDFSLYNYAANGSYSRQAIWGAFVGTEFLIHPMLNLAVGLGYYQPSVFSSGNGVLTQGIDVPSSNHYLYNYNVKSQQLLVEGKLLWRVHDYFHPFISVGLGAAFNTAYAFQAQVPPFLTFTPQFKSNTTSSFSYSIGIGMDVDIQKNWRLGASYRFNDLGKASLGAGYIDVTPFTPVLSQQNLYAQEVVAQLSYLVA